MEAYEYCHECQIKRGAEVPVAGHSGITVYVGKCSSCKEEKTLILSVDYDWPKFRKRAIFD